MGLIMEIMGNSSKACRVRFAGVKVSVGRSGEDGQCGG